MRANYASRGPTHHWNSVLFTNRSQALFEGYVAGAWPLYSTVIKWKTNSPWPALRGCLYDSYLAVNGAYWGVRAG